MTPPLSSVPTEASLPEALRLERLLPELSAFFSALAPQAIDGAFDQALARIVATLDIDRSTLNRVFPLTGRAEVTHSFAVEGVAPVTKRLIPARDSNPWALAKATAHESIVFSCLDELPPEASLDKESWRGIGLVSHVMMPILVAGELYGSLNFGCTRRERIWPHDLLVRMRLLAELFGAALARKRMKEELDLAIEFERLASGILASLVLSRRVEADRAIPFALQKIGEFVGAERVALWRSGDVVPSTHFIAMQQWHAAGFAGPAAQGRSSDLPWINLMLRRGHVVRIARLSELPPEAHADAAALRRTGVRSLLAVPITIDGRNGGALTLASIEREHEWPDTLMPGVSLLAEVFANLQAREAAERLKLAAEVEAAQWRERLAHIVRVHTAGEMSVALAHEITQPLGAIENYALAARRRIADAEPDLVRLGELIDKIVGQATRAGDVITRMRSMVQRHELEPKPIDIERAVTECMGMVKMDCDLRNIRISLARVQPPPVAVVDEIHLQQVVLNLLRNAAEATDGANRDDAREISVSLSLNERDEVLVEVADRGVGIAEGDLERVFETFYSTKSHGLGVGLAICRRLIEAHGGKLWASHRDGGGATFHFTLPAATAGEHG
jgi:signal transduction histidine kinase